MVIDFHTHCFPEKIVEKAISKLSAVGNIKNLTDGTADGMIRMMDECGIDYSVVCNIATNPRQQENVNNFAIYLKEHYDRLIPLGSVNPDNDEKNIREELLRIRTAGIKGIKIHPDYMGHAIDEDCYKPIFRACCDFDMFVVTHAGWDFISPDNIAATPCRIRKVIDEFSELKLVAAHFGGNRLWTDVIKYLSGRHVWFDTALGYAERMGADMAKSIIDAHDPEKILLGSDCPWSSPKNEYDFIMGLDITDEEKQNITFKNAQRLLRIS